MIIKVSDYIAKFCVSHGIRHGFSVTGGGAMHMNNSFGHQEGLTMVYNHHEQACAIAAESYARVHNDIALVCVTTGPGGINALNGVAGGYLDSIPMLIISGQVRYDTTARSTGLSLRAMGDQEFDICRAVDCMTKYCEMVIDPMQIRYCLEKALYIAKNGRPGPCWLDIPLNVQGAYVEEDDLTGYTPNPSDAGVPDGTISNEVIETILEKLVSAKRPVINAGNGIRLAGAFEEFLKLMELLQIPVVTGWDSIDICSDDSPVYAGRAGIMGDRPGNFAVQNSDVLLSIGSRLSIRQVGYNYQSWAREAYVIVNDIDEAELKKPTLHIDLPVCADAKDLIIALNRALEEKWASRFAKAHEDWRLQCLHWRERYPVVLPKYREEEEINVYTFIDELSAKLPMDRITVVGNGSACVVGSAAYHIKKGQRFIINSAIASMGYDLPAAIGACVESGEQELICISGEGSLQMNLQELQTIIHHRYPIKLFVINNQGYHSIRQTQTNFFNGCLSGVGPDSDHDLSFPDLELLAKAYGYPFVRVSSTEELLKDQGKVLDDVLSAKGPIICEIMVSVHQYFEPKSATKRLEDGTLVSAPLEDLAPFLPKEELEENMFIPLYEER